MQVMASVSRAAGRSIEELMSESREEALVEGRCAFIGIATELGYDLRTAMEIVDRDRTVGYNYRRKLEGHLRGSARFQRLMERSRAELEHRKPRAERQKAEPAARRPEPMPAEEHSPMGIDYTGLDLLRMRAHCKLAARFMRSYGRGRN